MENKKNLKQKLQEARMLLKKENITKSGKNSFTKVGYYTLSDILPPITRVCHEVRMTPLVTFDKEVATLTIYDWDSEETLSATSPMVEQKDGKMNEIQILGSLETYQRRYILQNVFDIVEEDNEVADSLEFHNIMSVKNRIEVLMTDLMKKGYDMNDVVTQCGLKDEKQYMQYLNACGVIKRLEDNMRVLLNNKE
ncbi:ERF family protein [bacterium]|nr:ERF family protein [bacterium]